MKHLIAAGLLFLAGPALAEAGCPAAPTPQTGPIAGVLGGEKIAVAELDATVAAQLCKAQMDYRRAIHDLRASALDDLVTQRLVEAEAKRRGLPNGATMMNKLSAQTQISPAQIKAFYDENKGRIDRPFDEVKGPIQEHLTQEAVSKAFTGLLTNLKKQNNFRDTLGVFRLVVDATGPSRGPADAPIEVVVFADYECPFCSRGATALEDARAKFSKSVRVIYKDFPLGFHKQAQGAAIAARCAGEQGKYWQMHDALYAAQRDLNAEAYARHAKDMNLNTTKFDRCLADPKHPEAVAADAALGSRLGVSGTPAFFINGVMLSGAQPVEAFTAAFERELARSRN